LDKDDLVQASEKAWGAAAHATKAVAEKWGWYHQGHYRLNPVVDHIAMERNRQDLMTLYLHPTTMHLNYYEHELDEDEDKVQVAIDATKVFVGEMVKIRAESVPSFPPPHTLTHPQQRRLRLLTAQPNDYSPRVSDISLLPPVDPDGQDFDPDGQDSL
jgi:hypothetical protein